MDEIRAKRREEEGEEPTASGRLIGDFLEASLTATLTDLQTKAWALGGDDELGSAFERVKQLRRLREALRTIVTRPGGGEQEPVYLVSSSLLREAYELVTKTRDESLIYATGPEDAGSLFALSQLVTFDLESASCAHASPEPKSQLTALAQLEKDGQRLLATLHSHPWRGAQATTPSSVDLNTQAELERMGYPTIGVVVSRTGHVRFYSKNRPFRVAVSGAGIEKLEDKLFRLLDTRQRFVFGRRSP